MTAGDRSAPGRAKCWPSCAGRTGTRSTPSSAVGGTTREAAEDLVQGFFTALLETESLATVDRTKGRFRSFLGGRSAHYLSNRHDHEQTLKRGRGQGIVPIDVVMAEDRYRNEPAHELTPERLFERRWATTLLDNVLGRLEAEMAAAGKEPLFAY